MRLAMDNYDLSLAQVAARFEQAKRRGNPAWLWPEVPAADWRAAQAEVAAALGAVLAGRTGALHGAPDATSLACYTSGTGPLLGWWHAQGLVDASPEVAAVLDLHLRHNRLRAERVEAAAVALVATLAARGIAVTVLKGAHTAHACFPDPATRPASDVDLLMREADVAAAEALIESMGYVPGSRGARESSWRPSDGPGVPRSLMLVHADDPWSIDLHHSLDIFAAAGAPLARLDLLDPMASRARWAPCPEAQVLGQPLLLLHLATHAGAGLHNLTLLRQAELVLAIRHAPPPWDAFLAAGERADALGFAWPALALCERLVPGTVPPEVLAHCARHAPAAVRRIVGRLTPATAQRVDRASIAEHFMWAVGWRGRLRQLAADLLPAAPWREARTIYEKRFWRLLRGRFSR